MNVQSVLPVAQLLLACCNIAILGYGLFKFLNKPHDTLEQEVKMIEKRVDAHDLQFKEIDNRLKEGNDNFREQKELNEVFINCMLAFIDFEMAYCTATGYKDIEDLSNAKQTLRAYLAKQ